jgi:hypothetical protein
MLETTYTWYDAQTNGINIELEGDDVFDVLDLPFSFTYYETSFDWIAVSSNGWLSFANPTPYEYTPVSYPTTDSDYVHSFTPIWLDLQADSNVYYWSTADMVVIEFNDYNYLGGDSLGTFQVVLHRYGDIIFNYQSMSSVIYGTTGLNHGDGERYNAYPSSSLTDVASFSLLFTMDDNEDPSWLASPEDFTVEAGTNFMHSFQATDNIGIASYTVNDTSRFTVSSSGFLHNILPLPVGNYGIEIVATDYFNNSISAEVTVVVQDTTAPTIMNPTIYVLVEEGESLSLNLTSYDFSGIDSYSVNDTRFSISDNGIITNGSALLIGNYSLKVSITDIYGNTEILDVTVVVYGSPTQPPLQTLILTFGTIGGLGIILILVIKRRISRSGTGEPSFSIG